MNSTFPSSFVWNEESIGHNDGEEDQGKYDDQCSTRNHFQQNCQENDDSRPQRVWISRNTKFSKSNRKQRYSPFGNLKINHQNACFWHSKTTQKNIFLKM